jgi:uncharacterized protein (DUF433 family)
MDEMVNLLDRPVYGMSQVDRLLGLASGTARRWIDGYERGGKKYPPVVRVEPTGEDVVTWGEFVETRLLSEYRDAGVSMVKMRPAVERLRETYHRRYPLAHARPYAQDRELVMKVQESVGLDRDLRLVLVRNGQLVLAQPAQNFFESAQFSPAADVVERLRPVSAIQDVVLDPLRQFGEPVVRSVRTEVIAEQVRAGEPIDAIAAIYELPRTWVEAAVRYELIRGESAAA